MGQKRKTNVFEPYEPAGAGRLCAPLARAELCAGGAPLWPQATAPCLRQGTGSPLPLYAPGGG